MRRKMRNRRIGKKAKGGEEAQEWELEDEEGDRKG